MALKHVEHLWVFVLHLEFVGLFDLANEELGVALGVTIVKATVV